MDQANLMLFPVEIARVVSILIQGSDHGGRKDAALKQVHTNKTKVQFSVNHATSLSDRKISMLMTKNLS